jgi:hypothetical protein
MRRTRSDLYVIPEKLHPTCADQAHAAPTLCADSADKVLAGPD